MTDGGPHKEAAADTYESASGGFAGRKFRQTSANFDFHRVYSPSLSPSCVCVCVCVQIIMCVCADNVCVFVIWIAGW